MTVLFSRAELFWLLWYRGIRGTFLRNYFEMRSLAKEEMAFKFFFFFFFFFFSILSSSGHIVQPRRTTLAILEKRAERGIIL